MLPVASPSQLKFIPLTNPVRRWLVLLPAIAVLAGSYFAVRWCAGSTMTQTVANAELAAFAVRLSPADPQTHRVFAKMLESSLAQADLDRAVGEYRIAVGLAPLDHRLWSVLGAAQERQGDLPGAERSYLRAVELAPDYALPRWAAGNFLLRHGDPNRAQTLLVDAGESMERLRRPVLDLLVSYRDGESPALSTAIGNRPEMRKAVVQFLLDRKDPIAALEYWSLALRPDERAAIPASGRNLLLALVALKRFPAAQAVANELSGGERFKTGQIDNFGFEAEVDSTGENQFGWRVGAGTQPQIVVDGSVNHTGRHSLSLIYQADGVTPLRAVTQPIVVTHAWYRLSYWVRSQDLKGQPAIAVEVSSAVDNSILARSTPLAAGSSEWRNETVEFMVPAGAEAVILRIGALPCSGEVCPLFGRIWYDDFELQFVKNASSAPR